MKIRFLTLCTCLLSLIIIGSCTTGYRLDPGNYSMILKLKSATQPEPKKVYLETKGDLVTIKNIESEEILTGTLKKNQLLIQIDQDGKHIEFSGKLVMDNRVQGNAKQSSGGEEDFNADFTLVKVAD